MKSNTNTYCVYCHLNKANGKQYIGQTNQPPYIRWGKDGRRYQYNKHFWAAIQRYGWNGFEHIVLYKDLTHEEANVFERLLIAAYQTTDRAFGYNAESGGTSDYVISDYTKDQISSTLKQHYTTPGNKHPMQGKHHTDESKQKMRNAKLGKHLSDEHKRRISQAGKGISKPVSDETRKKLSEIKQGRVWVTNGSESHLIPRSEVSSYMSKGYRFGFKGNTVQTRAFVTDGTITKRVNVSKVQEYLDRGFVLGTVYNKFI